MSLIYLLGKVEILYIIQYVLCILPRRIGFNSKAVYIAIVHCVKFTLCVTKMHQTLKQRYEGSSIKRRQQEWGRHWRIRGGDGGRSVLGGPKFQLLLGYRRSHKGRFMFQKKSRQKYL